MICITDIKIVEVSKNEVAILQTEGLPNKLLKYVCLATPPEKVEVTQEMIRGREFINADGERICIGMSKKVQDVLGLPFKTFESMNKELMDKRAAVSLLKEKTMVFQNEVKDFRTAGIFRRLKYLFTGKL